MSRRGLTLVEICLAFFLLTLAITTMVGLFISGLRLNAQSQGYLQATELARCQLEAIRDLREFPGPGRFDGRIPTPTERDFPPSPYPGLGQHKLVVSIEDSGKLKLVTVEAVWQDRQVRLQTLVYPVAPAP
ncbi:hypothetical protein DYH09_28880 [bacterium CPR1]|nr:hypothetical protein [bacterium CPR1]